MAAAERDFRGRGPVDLAQADEELFVDRLEQIEIEVAGPHHVGEVDGVFEEQRLDQSFQRVIASEKEQIRIRLPAADRARVGETGSGRR